MNLKAVAPKHIPSPDNLNTLQRGKLSKLTDNTTDRLAQLERPEFFVCTDVLLTAARIRRKNVAKYCKKSTLGLKTTFIILK